MKVNMAKTTKKGGIGIGYGSEPTSAQDKAWLKNNPPPKQPKVTIATYKPKPQRPKVNLTKQNMSTAYTTPKKMTPDQIAKRKKSMISNAASKVMGLGYSK